MRNCTSAPCRHPNLGQAVKRREKRCQSRASLWVPRVQGMRGEKTEPRAVFLGELSPQPGLEVPSPRVCRGKPHQPRSQQLLWRPRFFLKLLQKGDKGPRKQRGKVSLRAVFRCCTAPGPSHNSWLHKLFPSSRPSFALSW